MMVFGVTGALAAVVFIGSPVHAQDGSQMAVGTYQAQQIYRNYDGRQQMMQQVRQIQQQAQRAQQSGNQKQARQAQQQMRQKRQQIMQKFRADMQKAAKQVAQDEGIDVVAPRVTYTSERAKTKDITKPVTDAMNEMVDAGGDQQDQQTPQRRKPQGQR
jgi:Skp family chaperone for outer membrane proteins